MSIGAEILTGRARPERPTPPCIEEVFAGSLGVRLATSRAEVEAAQALRYRVFYDEMGAGEDGPAPAAGRDQDRFDPIADHMIIVDHAIDPGPAGVVGTYRLIRGDVAALAGGFYSESEFDIGPILAYPGRLLELGRSCIRADHRGRAAMQLMWRGIAAYVFHHRIDVMFGCASLPGTDPDALAAELTYLASHHLAPPALRPRAVASRYIDMHRLPAGVPSGGTSGDTRGAVDTRRMPAQLPPLIKGYLRLGGFVGDGAVIDRPFNTTDVAVVVKTDLVTDRYYRHYERQVRDELH